MSDEMIRGMFRTLSAILWIGNLSFQDTESEACQLTREDEVVVRRIAKLLGVGEAQVRKVCTIRQISVKGTTTDIALKYSEVRPTCSWQCWEITLTLLFLMSCRQERIGTPCPRHSTPEPSPG